MKTNVLLFTFLFLILTIRIKSAYKYSLQSGNWNQSSSWSGGSIPACGDSIVISPSHTINVTAQVSYNCSSRTTVVIKGALNFDGGNKLNMPCDSRVYVFGGGKITSDGGGNSNRIEICSVVLWSASAGQIQGPSCLPSNLPDCASVAPVELVSFDAEPCGDKICLNWSTATEHKNDYFVVQRLSGDVFADVQTIDSKSLDGNSKHFLSYNVKDEQPEPDLNYYRLKQVDFDGTFSLSKIVVVNHVASKTNAEIFPNPSSGDFTLKLDAGVSHEVNVVDCSGTTVRTVMPGLHENLHISDLAAGLYYCVIKSRDQVETLKVIVE